jgi:hypothetical protein
MIAFAFGAIIKLAPMVGATRAVSFYSMSGQNPRGTIMIRPAAMRRCLM